MSEMKDQWVPFTTWKKHKGEVGRGKSYKGKKKEFKAVKILGRRSTLSDSKRSFLESHYV